MIESLPEGLVGEWMIAGERYIANNETRFEQRRGDFAVGVCVLVVYGESDEGNVARYITTTGADASNECERDDDGGWGDGERAHCVIESLPEGLVGEWMIGGERYIANDETELEQRRGDFAVGVCVLVVYGESDEGNVARYIATTGADASNECERDDDGGWGDGERSHGVIESLPEGLVGEWMIAGERYIANNETRFEQRKGDFAVGVCVLVVYGESDEGNVARYIATTGADASNECERDDDGDDGDEGERERALGVIESLPEQLVGEWTIGGQSYIANDETKFEQRKGDFAVGLCVFVAYEEREEGHLAQYIATTGTNPDNACEQDDDRPVDKQMGTLESRDQNNIWGEWVVDGVTYAADPTIQVGSGSQTPEVGDMVVIESYQEGQTRHLTQVNAAFQLFIPTISSQQSVTSNQ